jgi:hypothetical protein
LDYNRVKEYIRNPKSEQIKICATLQALRWRITKVRRKAQIKQSIHAYMHYDLLGCIAEAEDASKSILDQLLSGDRKVLEYTMTLMNALASECLGRTYLLQKQNLVQILV